MTFNSLQYAVFLPLVLALYWCLPRRGQNLLILAASYAFYAAFDWRFLGLLLFTTTTDYTVGRLLGRTEREGRRRLLFSASLVANLGVLGFFKYYDFFTGEGTRLLAHLDLHLAPPVLRVLLPVGISFYTFHGISYSFDVYRRHIPPCRDPVAFAGFVAFFPQLVAGPIGRAHLQLPQFTADRRLPSRAEAGGAVGLILLGLFKKVVIADTVATYVDGVFSNPNAHSSLALLLGAYGFAVQIYGDFSGYTDIARGSAALFGISLPLNFEQPYLSRNITEFWRRWHISLSSWLRDYLYVPLGGNRAGRLATYRNLLLTMVLGGLWHGAAATFVVWGAWHGTLLALERRFRRRRGLEAGRAWIWPTDLLPTLLTFQLVCVGWVFFRAGSLTAAARYLEGIASLRGGPVDRNMLLVVLVTGALTLVLDLAGRAQKRWVPVAWPSPARGAAYGLAVAAILLCSGGTPVPFIYFRF